MERHTRFPHDPDYTALLGTAVYAFAYLEWLLLEVLRRLDPASDHSVAAKLTSGLVAGRLRSALSNLPAEETRNIGERFAQLVERRNDIIHAHPATEPDGSQRLYTWAPHKGRIAFVSDNALRTFIADVEALNRDANALRAFVKLGN